MRRFAVAAVAAALAAALVGLARAEPGTRSQLTAISGQGSGIVEVAPTARDQGSLTFDVQGTVNIHDAAPNTNFTVLRRVDLNPDGSCTGSMWLTLPGSPVLKTSAGGAGALHFEIQRGAPFFDGVSFDVQWRVVGAGGTVLLQSDCFTVTVK